MNIDRTEARWIWFGLAIKTRSSYDSAVRSYREHCMIWGLPVFPATIESLRSWVSTLGTRGLKAKSIKAYLTGVRSYHVDMGHPDETLRIFHSNALQRMINGIKRVHGESGSRERLPIVRPILMQLLETLDSSTLLGATLHSAFTLAFAALLRLGEITWTEGDIGPAFSDWHVTRGSVLLEETQLRITLPTSKTDPFRLGVVLTIAATGDSACAVASLKHLFRLFPRPLTDPLFFPDRAFTRSLVIGELKTRLEGLGHQGHYSGHSFRRGAATWAKERGLSTDDIKLLGRWKSDSYKLYLEPKGSDMMSASRRMQGPQMAAPIN
jgi:hypothetical protein